MCAVAGEDKIGSRCVVKTGSVVHDSVLGDEVVVEAHCVISASRLDSHVVVGPFARMRMETHLKSGSRIGNFVELKKSVVGEGTKAMHLTYLADARIGSKTNIGAGTITCNYDGFHKHPSTIGNKVFIGSDSALVAPVKVGDGAYVAAGSTITENVPADALGIARGRQVNKRGWATKKRRELAAGPAKHPRNAASSWRPTVSFLGPSSVHRRGVIKSSFPEGNPEVNHEIWSRSLPRVELRP